MGAYLSTPVTDKYSSDVANDLMEVGSSSMQGWRRSQEVSVFFFSITLFHFSRRKGSPERFAYKQKPCGRGLARLIAVLLSSFVMVCLHFAKHKCIDLSK